MTERDSFLFHPETLRWPLPARGFMFVREDGTWPSGEAANVYQNLEPIRQGAWFVPLENGHFALYKSHYTNALFAVVPARELGMACQLLHQVMNAIEEVRYKKRPKLMPQVPTRPAPTLADLGL